MSAPRGGLADVAAIDAAVAKAVAQERARWAEVEGAVVEVREAQAAEGRLKESNAAERRAASERVRTAEAIAEEREAEAAHLRTALQKAEGQLRELKDEANARAEAAGRAAVSDLVPATPSAEGGYAVVSGGGEKTGQSAASALAVERWEAEKKLQKKVEGLRAKLTDKGRELAATEAELARSRSQLEDARQREARARELLESSQAQLAKV